MEAAALAAAGWGISMAGWIISPYISKILNKANSHVEVDINISELETHLIPRLKFTLEAAEGSQNKAILGKLVSKLKSAFHETEDILDELEYIRHQNEAIQRRKHKSPESGPSNKILPFSGSIFNRHYKEARQSKQKAGKSKLPSNQFPSIFKVDLKKNIKIIRELIDEARTTLSSENGGSIPIWGSNLPNGSGSAEHGQSASPEGRVIGRDGVCSDIMKMLEHGGNQGSSDKCLSVIAIYGLPGSGKTTLAQHIFTAAETAEYFNLVVWIHVSEKFSVYDISKQIFQQAWEGKKQCPQYDNLVVLHRELKKLLFGKRFLLVLDDVWCSNEGNNDKKLPSLLPPLMTANRGSKILVTGRLADAVYELGPEVRIIDNSNIPELDYEVFLELFMHHAFGGHKERYQPLVTIGNRIAEKLKKSPLLAKAVGGVLRKKQDVYHWQSFEEQKIWEKHMGPLLWCYQNLDDQAKQCFAYCSIFPRGCRLYRHELVNLWVAEGFISTTEGGWDMEVVSMKCFDELLSVSFLQPGGKKTWEKDYFVIHDLLHDLAEMVAGSDCFKIGTAFAKAHPDVRHLSIERCSASMIDEDIIKLKNLRTLIIFYGEDDVNEEVLDKMFMELTKLRVLILQNVESASIPGSINYLKYLRYLQNRRINGGCNLPGTIGELYLLQVLDLEIQYGAELKLPAGLDVTGLTNLRHVINKSDFPFPNIGRLTSLQTMPPLDVGRGEGYELHQLGDLNNLRGKLEIKNLWAVNSKEEALQAKLADKRGVTSLTLSWYGPPSVSPEVDADVFEGLRPQEGLECMSIHSFNGSRYPEWMLSREKSKMELQRLELSRCSKLVPFPDLGLFFIGVTSLKLYRCDWDVMPYDMVHLTELDLCASDRDTLPGNINELTSLRRLIINSCLRFRWIPALPASLQYIKIEYCHDEFTISCIDEDHRNYKAIEHIPEKDIIEYPGMRGLQERLGMSEIVVSLETNSPPRTWLS